MSAQQETPIAVVLSGCGFQDGSEIHEAVSILLHLDSKRAGYQIFAPDKFQADVVDHTTGKTDDSRRHVIAETNRIARGQARPLGELNPSDFAAVVFPGGNGAIKNLCNFAEKRSAKDMEVDPDVSRVIRGFHDLGRPLAFCCIAPVIAAKVLGSDGILITLGENEEKGNSMVEGTGARVVASHVTKAVLDKANRIVTAPAYMSSNASISEVYQGIGDMIDKLLQLTGENLQQTSTSEGNFVNGIDTTALFKFIDQVKTDPKMRQSTWYATTTWEQGDVSKTHIDGWALGGEKLSQDFDIMVDEPTQLDGTGKYPNPQQVLFAAINTCIMNTFVVNAAVKRIRLEMLEIKLEGDIDLRGFLGVDDSVPAGYTELNFVLRVKGDGSKEQFEELMEMACKHSPNYYTITHQVSVNGRVEVIGDSDRPSKTGARAGSAQVSRSERVS